MMAKQLLLAILAGLHLRAERLCLVGTLLTVALAGCAEERGKPAELSDPGALITDDILERLAPGAVRVPEESLGAISGLKRCSVDLESDSSSMRGDLVLTVSVGGVDMYGPAWQKEQCASVNAQPAADGPGDRSCVRVRPWSDGEARVDALAWLGNDYQARVGYQVVRPRQLPPSAEQDVRVLLEAAVNVLASGR
ncbi:hypothetical protein [Actinoplanes aureus]|uniref:DUF3558 domain-containing protein n=1 Tax=Actinoplanes aureus TaxID=2792083 RepID=A0A931G8K3_9ACTN|nr:hypothetical protein [Actinoplanes aureus]MBG0569339.1 hypothetical protein [Actinoplanes aureus]